MNIPLRVRFSLASSALLLIAHAAPAKDFGGIPELHAATWAGDAPAVLSIIDRGDDVNARDPNGNTPLALAASKGNSSIVDILLGAHARVNDRGEGGKTPLFMASADGHWKIVDKLLRSGADAGLVSGEGSTPLWVASANGHTLAVWILLEANADPAVANKFGETPLFAAAAKGHLETVQELLDDPRTAATIGLKEPGGRTPQMAAESGNFDAVAALLANPPKPHPRTTRADCAALYSAAGSGKDDAVAALLDKGVLVDCRSGGPSGDMPALIAAAGNGRLSTVQLLIKRGADPKRQTEEGRTALDYAQLAKHEDVVALIGPKPRTGECWEMYNAAGDGKDAVVQAFLDKRVPVDCPAGGPDKDMTALMTAAANGRASTAKLLLKRGADPKLKLKGGETALDYAKMYKRKSVIAILEKADPR